MLGALLYGFPAFSDRTVKIYILSNGTKNERSPPIRRNQHHSSKWKHHKDVLCQGSGNVGGGKSTSQQMQ